VRGDILGVRFLLVLLAGSLAAAQSPADTVKLALGHAKVRAAIAILERDHDTLVADIVALTEIPAPPFKEDARASAYLNLLSRTSLTNVEKDAEGNVMGLRKGTGGGPLIAIAAHLDTVFPEGTDVHVRRSGRRLAAPGIGDDSRGLAVLLALIRALDEARIQTTSDILFVGNVGEEGLGDLRGVRYLFTKGPYKDRIKMFISLDGPGGGQHIVDAAVGSRRYRVTFKGPGGHSYGAFGLVNPAFALGSAIEKLSRITVPAAPKTTFSVGVIGGGTSVNSIPASVWAEIDLRSESPAELDRIDRQFKAAMLDAANEENAARSTSQGKVTADISLIGDRPSGSTPRQSTLVATAAAVVRAGGMTPSFGASSTDANVPISLGIPAITLDTGGTGGREHSPDEWIDVAKASSLPGVKNVLVLLVSIAGLH
jgi:tripeptide aminopeptidase